MLNDTWQIYTDGGSRGNPGPSACAFVISNIYEQGFYLGVGTNNNAEYQGVLRAFQYLNSINTKPQLFNFFLDSELVVKQLNGIYKVKDSNLQKIYLEIKNFQRNLHANFAHIPREQNSAADLLVNKTLDQYQ